jgi:methylenetetrahydrofolate dehydrogenase (NADP+)/methenyltetrahydrofolate cyclohydrolase
MSAQRLDGRALAREIRAEVAQRAEAFTARAGRPPTLVSLLVGDDDASLSYARSKARQAAKIGIDFRLERMAASDGTARIVNRIEALCASPDVDALIVEMPLPRGIDVAAVQDAIDPRRDADGVSPDSLGRLAAQLPGPRPATPLAVMALLDAAEVDLSGKRAVVVGRSKTVGLPAALMLLARHATVTIVHSRTPDLTQRAREADVLVVATGRPGLIGPEAVGPGATVIDVGTNWVSEPSLDAGGRLVGDVDPAAAEVAGLMSPVPGGVGPVTTAVLLRTTLSLAEAGIAEPAGTHEA